MTMKLLWYVLAGVLLGFAASTLWEWLYFRRKRIRAESRRVQELEEQLAEEQALNEQMRMMQDMPPPRRQPEYSSPGVFLDSETAEERTASPSHASGHRSSDGLPQDSRGVPQEQAPAFWEEDLSAELHLSDREVTQSVGRNKRDDHLELPASNENTQTRQSSREPAIGAAKSESVIFDQEGEEESVTLERLAAELAQAPDEPPPTGDVANRPPKVARSVDFPDNLSVIKGIGDVYKFRLFAAGIFTWHQVAETDIETLRTATNAYPGSNVEEWPEQARALAKKHGREGAYYSGPVPDDLTQIIGIGPVGERTLYRAGICTYDQLAGATASELQELFPIAIAGDQPDFNEWIRLAIDFAKRKGQT